MFKCQRNYQYLLLPTRAYVTFENELSQTVMRTIKQAPLVDVMCTFEPATEPSDINWENRNYKKPLGKKIGLLLIYFLLILMFNFGFQVWAEHSINISISKYSDYTPCEEILQMSLLLPKRAHSQKRQDPEHSRLLLRVRRKPERRWKVKEWICGLQNDVWKEGVRLQPVFQGPEAGGLGWVIQSCHHRVRQLRAQVLDLIHGVFDEDCQQDRRKNLLDDRRHIYAVLQHGHHSFPGRALS